MRCLNPACHYNKTQVIDSIACDQSKIYRRRRYCYKCHTRYTTLELPIYLGGTNTERRCTLKQITRYFSDALDPYPQWGEAIQALNVFVRAK